MGAASRRRAFVVAAAVLVLIAALPVAGETDMRVNLELYSLVYRGLDNWYHAGSGLADLRAASEGNAKVKAEAAMEFSLADAPGAAAPVPAASLKRMWVKADFPLWRLTAGKTKLAWGNGSVFNAGDVIFGSLTPAVDFTKSTIRSETAFLVAFNVPLGRFSYIEGVMLPPGLSVEEGTLRARPLDYTSGGMRFFTRIGGFRLEGGYLYKGDAKVSGDLLGHRPYLSFHGHAGIDFYGSISLAAGFDSSMTGTDRNRDTWGEIAPTLGISVGIFHRLRAGYSGSLSFRLEALVMPGQNWKPVSAGAARTGRNIYAVMLYPEIQWTFFPSWTLTLQALVSPVDSSAQVTTGVSWRVFQGFTLLCFITSNAGEGGSLFAWDRSGGSSVPKQSFNGIGATLGARFSY